jgi:two-component system, NarL family, nitrate/nitrite response regulator NarL
MDALAHSRSSSGRRRRHRVRLLIADSHPLFLEGLARAVKERPDLELIGSAADGRQALAKIAELRPDVALIDVQLDRLDGTRVLAAVTRDGLPTRVLFLSALLDGELIYESIAAGAAGYLSKDADRVAICDGVVAASRGQTVLSPEAQAAIAGQISTRFGEDQAPLTTRERQVLELIADGNTVARVAERLELSRATVKTHLQHLYDKLGVTSQAAAVAEALRRGLIE